MSALLASDGKQVEAVEGKPFWGMVNGKPLRIRRIGVTGDFASGKSLFIDRIDTRNTFKIDLEASSDTFNLPFKKYVCLYDHVRTVNESGIPTALECFQWFDDMLEKIQPGEYTVVAVDPINEIQAGCYDWVYSNPGKFGRTKGQYDKMTALCWGDVKTYLDMRIGMLTNKIETFAYTVHMGQVWRDGKPVEGKKRAKGSDVFRKMADIFFVLSRPVDPATGQQPDKPIGIIAPPIGKCRLVHANPDDSDDAQPILPPAIPNLTANKIREYIDKPPNYSDLKDDQLVPIHHLSDDDKLEIELRIAEAKEETERMRAERLGKVAEAAERNKKAAEVAEPEEVAGPEEVVAAVEVEKTNKFTPTEELPTQVSQTIADPAYANFTDADRRTMVIEMGKKLWGSRVKEGLVRSIEKRAGKGAKLAEMGSDQLKELQSALWNALNPPKE